MIEAWLLVIAVLAWWRAYFAPAARSGATVATRASWEVRRANR